jgi:pyruvate dehydrogenase E2 component (dihydrolipoamide acetyltransferase)
MAEIINMPKLGFDMAEGTLVRWLKKVGETVNKGEVLAEIETDKATVEVESLASGVVRKLLVDEGAVVPVNTPIAVVGSVDEKIEELVLQVQGSVQPKTETIAPVPETSPVVQPVPITQEGKVHAISPLARRMALEKQLDLSTVKGTGPGGRVVRRDIDALLAGQISLGSGRTASVLQSQYDSPVSLSDQTLSISKLRAAIGRRMTESKTSIPHFYVTHEYKMDALLILRTQFNNIVPEDEKLSINDFIVKAVAQTLHQFPNLNASLKDNAILRHAQVNIGIAVSVEGGLLTIVCREADRKPLRQVGAEIKVMAARVRAGKVKPEDIEGSTFSISNLGMYDVEDFSAIINPPEAAILAVSSAREQAVVEGGGIKSGWRMKATISVDHRISDGVEAAKFLQALALFLEEPLRLVL